MHRAVFLDRDGVINRKAPTEDEYVTRWEEMEILPGVAEAVTQLNQVGYSVYVVTNQRSVAKGFITAGELELLHQRLCEYLGQQEARIDGVYYCPHEVEPPCECRKPSPGMLLKAAREHDIDLHVSWMIGDSVKDIEAGKRAGCKTALITSNGNSSDSDPDVVASSLPLAVDKILRHAAHANCGF